MPKLMLNPVLEARRAQLWDDVDRASKALRAVHGVMSGPMGLTPDDVRARDDYKAAFAAWRQAHANLRAFNAKHISGRKVRA